MLYFKPQVATDIPARLALYGQPIFSIKIDKTRQSFYILGYRNITMGIIGTLSLAHKVYSAHLLRETQDADAAGSRTRGRLPKWHRHRQQFHAVASPNRESLDSWAQIRKVPASRDLYSDSDSESESNPGSGDFDASRTKKSSGTNNPESLDLHQLVSCWWPLNICHEMRTKLHQIVEHSADMKVVWPSGSNGRIGWADRRDSQDMHRFFR